MKKTLFITMIYCTSAFSISIEEIREANPDFEEWAIDEVYREQLAIDIERAKTEENSNDK